MFILMLVVCLWCDTSWCNARLPSTGTLGFQEESKILARAEEIYSGNPSSEKVVTYVYLRRKGHLVSGAREKLADVCSCKKCAGKIPGLSLGFICVDEEDGVEFTGVPPSGICNVIWTASMSFGYAKSSDEWSRYPGILHIHYDFCRRYTHQSGEAFDGERLREEPDFLHNDDDTNPCLSRSSPEYRVSLSELSIVNILRTALFRWKIPYNRQDQDDNRRISYFLRTIGRGVGEESEGKRLVPKYQIAGFGGYNCALFSEAVLGVLGAPRRVWVYRPLAIGANLLVGTLDGALIGSAGGPLGAAVGAVVGLTVDGVLILTGSAVRKGLAATPNAVINGILSFYIEAYKKDRNIDDSFRIIAHDRNEVEKFVSTHSTIDRFDEYSSFLLKSISDVVSYNVKIGNSGVNLFLKTDFEPSSGGCSIQ